MSILSGIYIAIKFVLGLIFKSAYRAKHLKFCATLTAILSIFGNIILVFQALRGYALQIEDRQIKREICDIV
jgi:hypothetical protein